jgi:hypothetical protein
LEEGDAFASEASRAIMLGIISVLIFCLAYSRMAVHLAWVPSVVGGLGLFFVSTYFLDLTNVSLAVGFVTVFVVLSASLALIPRVGSDSKLSSVSPTWDIPARMVSATTLVFIITGVAPLLGPQLTGLLTPFPIYAITLAVFVHRLESGTQAVRLLRGVVAGSFTFAVFFLVISTTILSWGMGASFICAIGIGLLTHAGSLQFLKRVHS